MIKCDVAIIGGGPSGLAAATELKSKGIKRVIVIEREDGAGGIPRHCGHPPFGMREFGRVLTGPKYATRLLERAIKAGVEILLRTNVVAMMPDATLTITSDNGLQKITARRVIYATGARETTRAGRMLGGQRPMGVMNTGALQSLIFEQGKRPFKRPVIVGTELVAFSAIMTCHHAGIKPVAMLEASNRVSAFWPSGYFAMLRGVPLHRNTSITRIIGGTRVEAVEIADKNGTPREILCDGVILTGQFRPESSLCQASHLHVQQDTLGPVVDPQGRCSDPSYFATGNVVPPLHTGGKSWREGCRIGRNVALDLA